ERQPVLIVSAVEHKAVLESARRAEREGARLEVVPVDREGRVRPDALREAASRAAGSPCLVSLMWANNEVGTVQPIREAAAIAHEHGALLHTDAVQAFGKVPVSFREAGADLLSVTAHKLGGPMGIGALLVREGVDLEPLTFGGSQERGLWPGTQNALGAVGFAEAARLAVEALPGSARRWRGLRDRLASTILETSPDARLHGGGAAERLPNLVSVGLPGVDTGELLVSLDLEGVAASSGSACSSGSHELSHVLRAMGVDPGPGPYGVLRLSLGPSTTEDEVERAVRTATRVLGRLAPSRRAAPSAPGGAPRPDA
ncbi:MAG TPA: aminotransferase class V-fold PLP-dependent enzyme, partial [Gemmatimonadota bacterium]|nr:aminotransferase class V-fold PLP-dependent enzyme [Gemmatimonadota bacterium]